MQVTTESFFPNHRNFFQKTFQVKNCWPFEEKLEEANTWKISQIAVHSPLFKVFFTVMHDSTYSVTTSFQKYFVSVLFMLSSGNYPYVKSNVSHVFEDMVLIFSVDTEYDFSCSKLDYVF